MQVDFWFDPGCPFTWIASRWVESVVDDRQLDVAWRPFSLLIKNQTAESSPWFGKSARSRALLRVVERARTEGHAGQLGSLYTVFGRRIHGRGELNFDVVAALAEANLPAKLASALDDDSLDEAIEESMSQALALAGDDAGSPVIAIDGPTGRVGFSGPVLTELPPIDEAGVVWDALVTMMSTEGFHELKRARRGAPIIPPDVT